MHQSIVKYNDLTLSQLIRDLNWVIRSPGLLAQPPPQVKWDLLPADHFHPAAGWLNRLPEHPDELIDFFQSDQQFILGKYFEKLLYFSLLKTKRVGSIISGLQIEKNNRTIGEIDFLFQDLEENKAIHLEVAVKYYMGFGSSGKHAMWIGPNGLDNLGGKIQKFSTQLSMVALAGDQLGIDVSTLEKRVLLKGYFFRHIDTEVLPRFCHSDVLTGRWLYVSELEKIIRKGIKYAIVPKQYWLGFYPDMALKTYDDLSIAAIVGQEINRVGKGILLAEFDESVPEITAKYMIAPEQWPKLV